MTYKTSKSLPIALITGASHRIGEAMARHLAQKRWSLAIHYNHSATKANKLAAELTHLYPEASFKTFKAELQEVEAVGQLMSAVIKTMGIPFLIINNASAFEPGNIKQTDSTFFDSMMAINLRAPLILMRDFANSAQNGLIINIVDTRITNNQSSHAAYSLSKKGLWELTKMAAHELGPNIRVNAIAPGVTMPPADKDNDYLNQLASNIVMKRPGGTEPILKSIDYIIDNDYLTGQLIFCDGGENLGKTN